MIDIAIRVENLSKQYRISAQKPGDRTFREAVTDTLAAPFRRICSAFQRSNVQYIWALKDVSFEVKRGEVAISWG